MQCVGLFEDHSSLIEDPSSSPGVDGGGREQPQVYVPVVVVVPIDEPAAAVEGVVEALEAIWEVGMVLERLELALGVGVVVACERRLKSAARGGRKVQRWDWVWNLLRQVICSKDRSVRPSVPLVVAVSGHL